MKDTTQEEVLILKDADDNVYRIPWSEIKKYAVSNEEAQRRITEARARGRLTEAIGGCTNRPCVN